MKLRRQKQTKPASGTFESEFAIEILKSDKLRVTILICFFGVALPSILLLAVFAFEDFQRIFHGNFKIFVTIVLTVLGVGLGCFAAEWLAINRRIKQQRKADPLLPYLRALVETSIP